MGWFVPDAIMIHQVCTNYHIGCIINQHMDPEVLVSSTCRAITASLDSTEQAQNHTEYWLTTSACFLQSSPDFNIFLTEIQIKIFHLCNHVSFTGFNNGQTKIQEICNIQSHTNNLIQHIAMMKMERCGKIVSGCIWSSINVSAI